MNYQETLNYLFEQLPMFQRIGAAAYKADLGNIIALCNLLLHPQNQYPCIHIAGTNGKGSVTHILAAILQAKGYKTGVFTSPHYKDYRERIKIDGKLISKQFVMQFVEKYQNDFKQIDASFFEITNALAFYYFAKKKVDVAIIETGMGGRLDSTNIIHPIVSIITNISFDHTQFLGDTLAKIAAEKAGIIKEKTPVIIGESTETTHPVFLENSKAKNAPIVFANENPLITDFISKKKKSTFWYYGIKYKTDLTGDYQAKNMNTAFAALPYIDKYLPISQKAVKKGIRHVKSATYFIGRWMLIQRNPLVIFDSAHNEAGIIEVIKQLKKYKYHQLHIVYGTVSDKNIENIAAILPPEAKYYFCKPAIPRGKDTAILQKEMKKSGISGITCNSVKAAYTLALQSAKKNDLIIVTGSIFVVAELL